MEFYGVLWEFIKLDLITHNPVLSLLTVDRPVDRTRAQSIGRSTDVHSNVCTANVHSLGLGLINRAIDRPREQALWFWPRSTWRSTNSQVALGWSTGRSTDSPNDQKSDRWPVDRTVDWQVIFDLIWTPTAIFSDPINMDPLRPISAKIFERNFSHLLNFSKFSK